MKPPDHRRNDGILFAPAYAGASPKPVFSGRRCFSRGVPPDAQLSPDRIGLRCIKYFITHMATKENKRQVRELVEGLEQRIHCGPVILDGEIQSARDFLRRHDFAPTSDYFNRLASLEQRVQGRVRQIFQPPVKRNYGGKAGGAPMQVQSIFDHVILSTCYAGDFNTKRGRIKISHRFNQEGRIDFVELKFLNSLHPPLNGELRKLVTVKDYGSIRKDWFEAEASVLGVLPQELIFLYADIFRCSRSQLLAGLVNVGHEIVEELLRNLKSQKDKRSPSPGSGPVCPDFSHPPGHEPNLGWPPETWNQNALQPVSPNGHGRTVCLERPRTERETVQPNGNRLAERSPQPAGYQEQLPLEALLQDEVALPILEQAAQLESVAEIKSPTEILVRYLRQIREPNRLT